jgi:hypothetical protein
MRAARSPLCCGQVGERVRGVESLTNSRPTPASAGRRKRVSLPEAVASSGGRASHCEMRKRSPKPLLDWSAPRYELA